MNGPEHYRAAEGWLAEVKYDTATQAIAAAQVHATLAVAGAGELPVVPGMTLAEVEAAIAECGGDDPEGTEQLIAQRDIWEDFARRLVAGRAR